MPAGDLRYRVKFSERNEVGDVYGNPTTAWVDRFTVAANIVPMQGDEAVNAERLAGRQPVIIRVRRSADTARIRTDWKATNTGDGTQYNIRTAIDPMQGSVEHGKWIECMAEAGVAI